MRFERLNEAANLPKVAIIFGRFQPAHEGHVAAWEKTKQAGPDGWYVGTNPNTMGAKAKTGKGAENKDPLPYDLKALHMTTLMPELKSHLVPETNWMTLATLAYNHHGKCHLSVVCSEEEEYAYKLISKWNGQEGKHGYYNFASIDWVQPARSHRASDVRAAVHAGDRAKFASYIGQGEDYKVQGKNFFDIMAHYLEVEGTEMKESSLGKIVRESEITYLNDKGEKVTGRVAKRSINSPKGYFLDTGEFVSKQRVIAKESLEESLNASISKVVDDINKKFNELFGINTAMYSTKTSNRMWTRGDGSRYKEPAYIYPAEETYIFKNYPETAQKFDGTRALTDFAWEHITSLPGAKSIGKIKGEFGSSEYSEAFQVGKVIFIRDNFVIRYGTKSLLRNTDVWKQENESVEEDVMNPTVGNYDLETLQRKVARDFAEAAQMASTANSKREWTNAVYQLKNNTMYQVQEIIDAYEALGQQRKKGGPASRGIDANRVESRSMLGRVVAEQDLEEGVNDPHIFKAVFLAGGPGSGKSFVSDKLMRHNGLRVVNSDDIYEYLMKKQNLPLDPETIFSPQGQEIRGRAKDLTKVKKKGFLDGRIGLIIDGTGKDVEKVARERAKLQELGYDTMMLFVNTSHDVAQERNKQRERSLEPGQVTKMWNRVQDNIMKFQQVFGAGNFLVLDNSGGLEDPTRAEEFHKVWKHIERFVNAEPSSHIAKKWIDAQRKGDK